MRVCPNTGENCEAFSLVTASDSSLDIASVVAAEACSAQSNVDVYEVGRVRLDCGLASYLVQKAAKIEGFTLESQNA